ncbi:MAG: TlpA disulfide reductase family protein [Acidimicrobiales bacterium]|nr:TlpA disulfide reductase family protein [Acidimicrobiales bacterium]
MSTRNQPTRQRPGANPAIVIGVVVAVLVIAAIAVFVTAGGDDGEDVTSADTSSESSPYGIVTVQGEALPPAPDGGVDPAVGTVAPTIISERVEGQVRVDPGEEDQPVMLVFLAHWCPHCQRELPRLVELQEQGAFDGIRTVAVLTSTTDERDNFPPSAWLDDEGWTGDRLFDDEDSTAGAAYGLSSFPMMAFLDADGEVVQRLSGEQDPATIEAAIAEATGPQ